MPSWSHLPTFLALNKIFSHFNQLFVRLLPKFIITLPGPLVSGLRGVWTQFLSFSLLIWCLQQGHLLICFINYSLIMVTDIQMVVYLQTMTEVQIPLRYWLRPNILGCSCYTHFHLIVIFSNFSHYCVNTTASTALIIPYPDRVPPCGPVQEFSSL